LKKPRIGSIQPGRNNNFSSSDYLIAKWKVGLESSDEKTAKCKILKEAYPFYQGKTIHFSVLQKFRLCTKAIQHILIKVNKTFSNW
jgi:hypothetical protein